MASPAQDLPEILTSCRFYLTLGLTDPPESIDAYFMECKGFKTTQEVVEICEVTPQKWGKNGQTAGRVVRTKIPGNVKNNNITLRRGMTRSRSLWEWFEAVQRGNWASDRKQVCLTIYNQKSEAQARFFLSGAWPTSYILSDVNSSSNEIEIEELELAFEEFVRDSTP